MDRHSTEDNPQIGQVCRHAVAMKIIIGISIFTPLGLHTIPVGWAAEVTIPLKNEGTGDWVAQGNPAKGLYGVHLNVWIPENCSFHTSITSQQSKSFRSLNMLCSKPHDILLPQDQTHVTNNPQSWWILLGASLGLTAGHPLEQAVLTFDIWVFVCVFTHLLIKSSSRRFLMLDTKTLMRWGQLLLSPDWYCFKFQLSFWESIWNKMSTWAEVAHQWTGTLEAQPLRIHWVLGQRSEPKSLREEPTSLISPGSSVLKDYHLLA